MVTFRRRPIHDSFLFCCLSLILLFIRECIADKIPFPHGFVTGAITNVETGVTNHLAYMIDFSSQSLVGSGVKLLANTTEKAISCSSDLNGHVFVARNTNDFDKVYFNMKVGPGYWKLVRSPTGKPMSIIDSNAYGSTFVYADSVGYGGAGLMDEYGGRRKILFSEKRCTAATFCHDRLIYLACTPDSITWTLYRMEPLKKTFTSVATLQWESKIVHIACSPAVFNGTQSGFVAFLDENSVITTYDPKFVTPLSSTRLVFANSKSFAFDRQNSVVVASSGVPYVDRSSNMAVQFLPYSETAGIKPVRRDAYVYYTNTASSNGGQVVVYPSPNYAFVAIPESVIVLRLDEGINALVEDVIVLDVTRFGQVPATVLCGNKNFDFSS